MLSVGEKLRRARLEQGLEIASLAARTKINARFLEAIEADQRDRLPAGFFYRNWTIQYARALSLDEKEVQDGIDRTLSVEAPLPLPGQVQRASRDLPSANRNFYRGDGAPRLLLSFAVLVLVLVGCSGFYAWWHKQQQERQNNPIARIKESAPAVPDAPKRTPPPPQISQPAKPAVAEAAAVSEPVSEAPSNVSDVLLVELHAREQTWLVISPDGKQIFAGVLEANQNKTVEARESARIKIGNAGGIDIRLNGKPVGEIGPKGKVRVLLFGPNGVRIVEPRRAVSGDASPVAELDRSAALALSLE